MNTMKIAISGMTCQGCADSVEKAISRIEGRNVVAQVDVTQGVASVAYNAADTQAHEIIAAIEEAGFDATILESD